MAYDGNGTGRRLGEGVYWGRSEESLQDAIAAAVNEIPDAAIKSRKGASEDEGEARFVVSSIVVEVIGDPNVGAYSVTVT